MPTTKSFATWIADNAGTNANAATVQAMSLIILQPGYDFYTNRPGSIVAGAGTTAISIRKSTFVAETGSSGEIVEAPGLAPLLSMRWPANYTSFLGATFAFAMTNYHVWTLFHNPTRNYNDGFGTNQLWELSNGASPATSATVGFFTGTGGAVVPVSGPSGFLVAVGQNWGLVGCGVQSGTTAVLTKDTQYRTETATVGALSTGITFNYSQTYSRATLTHVGMYILSPSASPTKAQNTALSDCLGAYIWSEVGRTSQIALATNKVPEPIPTGRFLVVNEGNSIIAGGVATTTNATEYTAVASAQMTGALPWFYVMGMPGSASQGFANSFEQRRSLGDSTTIPASHGIAIGQTVWMGGELTNQADSTKFIAEVEAAITAGYGAIVVVGPPYTSTLEGTVAPAWATVKANTWSQPSKVFIADMRPPTGGLSTNNSTHMDGTGHFTNAGAALAGGILAPVLTAARDSLQSITSITIDQANTTMRGGTTSTFTATVVGSPTTKTWSLNTPTGPGTFAINSGTGLVTAPGEFSSGASTAVVRATSADPTKYSERTVTTPAAGAGGGGGKPNTFGGVSSVY